MKKILLGLSILISLVAPSANAVTAEDLAVAELLWAKSEPVSATKTLEIALAKAEVSGKADSAAVLSRGYWLLSKAHRQFRQMDDSALALIKADLAKFPEHYPDRAATFYRSRDTQLSRYSAAERTAFAQTAQLALAKFEYDFLGAGSAPAAKAAPVTRGNAITPSTPAATVPSSEPTVSISIKATSEDFHRWADTGEKIAALLPFYADVRHMIFHTALALSPEEIQQNVAARLFFVASYLVFWLNVVFTLLNSMVRVTYREVRGSMDTSSATGRPHVKSSEEGTRGPSVATARGKNRQSRYKC